MKIHDVKTGKNRYCGPAAISAITGRPVDEVVAGFHALTPGDHVMGTGTAELARVLALYGLRLASIPEVTPRPTLAKWLRENKGRRTPGRVFLLASAHHWVVISGRRIVCGKVLKVMSVRDYPIRRGRVTRAYEVTGELRRGVPDKIKAHLEGKKRRARESSKESALRSKLRKLADQYKVTIEPDMGSWWVYPPHDLYPDEGDDPFDGSHFCDHWSEIAERIETYVAEIQRRESVITPEPPTPAGLESLSG